MNMYNEYIFHKIPLHTRGGETATKKKGIAYTLKKNSIRGVDRRGYAYLSLHLT